jgi:hypothetical protein
VKSGFSCFGSEENKKGIKKKQKKKGLPIPFWLSENEKQRWAKGEKKVKNAFYGKCLVLEVVFPQQIPSRLKFGSHLFILNEVNPHC